MNKLKISLAAILALSCQVGLAQSKKLTSYVDPMIGSGFHGHVFVGASVPFGAVQLGPTNVSQGWDWSSGYHVSDSTIVGFQHTHLSGTGIGDLGDISIMPTTGPLVLFKGAPKSTRKAYLSLFDHKDEVVRPGYYKVKLKTYNIGAELTATTRVGLHNYSFPQSAHSRIIIDLEAGISDRSAETFIKKLDSHTIVGYRYSKGWARDQRIYFAAVFQKPIADFKIYSDTTAANGNEFTGTKAKGVISFSTSAGEQMMVKVGISPVSTDNAMLNIRTELPGWDFKKVADAADAAWNKELGVVQIKADSLSQLKKFYTAMYHTLIAPSVFNDVNGDYQGADRKNYNTKNFTDLTTFSLWDTYRAANPLYTITQPKHVTDMINSMLYIYKQQGKLPVWHLMGNETNTMPGNSALPVVADAVLKGFKGVDYELAFEAAKATALLDERGLKFLKHQGYIPADSTVESVAMGLEYAIDDWCVAHMALKLGKKADYDYFMKRGNNYRNYFNKQTGFMQGRVADNAWREPFSPFVSKHRRDDYAEGNAWQYTWLVPQDVEGLIGLLGGDRAFTAKLDTFFVIKGDMGSEASNDISGLIGQYAHGNEPSHHITYLYTYAGQPWKTAEKVRYILNNFYTDKHDGIIGNEDVGQMSAWYVLSALGFYPVNPANGAYVFGSPTVNEAVINLPANRQFKISVKNNSAANKYIQGVVLNGKAYTKSYLLHQTITNGGQMVITMGSKPSATWGVNKADRPVSKPKLN